MPRIVSIVLGLSLVVAGCGDDDTTTTTTTTTSVVASPTTTTSATTVAVTTTVAETSTTATTTATTTSAVVDTVVFEVEDPHVLPAVFSDAGANGSGCVVSGDVLLPGVWMGFATAVGGGEITFDLVCYFSGDAADAAANADYGGTNGAEEGFYIRNQNPKLFTVPIAPEAAVYSIDAAGPTSFPEPIPLGSWPSPSSWLSCPGEDCAVWLYVNGGVATAIVEQFLP